MAPVLLSAQEVGLFRVAIDRRCSRPPAGAREVVVGPYPTRAALVRLVVVRYDVAAYPASAA